MNNKHISPEVLATSNKHQKIADRLTAFRKHFSGVFGGLVALTDRRWSTTFVGGALVASDLLDGYHAKKAQRLINSNKPLSNGATEDPIADKIYRKSIQNGMLGRAFRERDYPTVATLWVKSAVDKHRDDNMTESRNKAKAFTKLGVEATNINRTKTAIDMVAGLVHISPLAEKENIRNFALGAMAVSSVVGIIGEQRYSKAVQAEMDYNASRAPHKVQAPQPIVAENEFLL